LGESERDTGLVRTVGTWGLAASIVNTVIGAGIFAVPAALAACIGSYGPLAFAVCAVAIGAVAICFAEGGSRVPTSGGAYGYIEAAFGPLAGYVAGTCLWFSDALACGGIAAALADVGVSVLPPALRPTAHAMIIVGAIGGIALVNLGGAARGLRFINAATFVKLLPLAIFVVVGASGIQMAHFAAPSAPSTQGLGRAVILALFAFTGMEAPLSASGEVVAPTRTIPRALLIAMLSVTALYVLIQIVAQGILGPALASSTAPLADAIAQVSPPLRVLLLGGAAVSMFAWLGSDVLGTPRLIFALARDGLLPRVLGRVHPRTHAPHVAILAYSAFAIALALSGTFAELAVLSTLACAVVYIAGCAAALRLARRGVALAGEPLAFRWLTAAAGVGIASMLLLIALGSRAEILGLLVLLAVSVALFALRTRSPSRAA
jgi:APA family basic amino acid/polyamine antiporter